MKKERKENASHLVSILYPGIIKKKTKKILSLFEVDIPRPGRGSRPGLAWDFWGRIPKRIAGKWLAYLQLPV